MFPHRRNCDNKPFKLMWLQVAVSYCGGCGVMINNRSRQSTTAYLEATTSRGINTQHSAQNDLHFEHTWAEHWHSLVPSDMIRVPLWFVTDSCTMHPGCKCYEARGCEMDIFSFSEGRVPRQPAGEIHGNAVSSPCKLLSRRPIALL